MELYHWYKGTELPDAECDCRTEYDCVVVYHIPLKLAKRFGIISAVRKTLGQCIWNGERYCFADEENDIISASWIIAWMPIEFPEEVE